MAVPYRDPSESCCSTVAFVYARIPSFRRANPRPSTCFVRRWSSARLLSSTRARDDRRDVLRNTAGSTIFSTSPPIVWRIPIVTQNGTTSRSRNVPFMRCPSVNVNNAGPMPTVGHVTSDRGRHYRTEQKDRVSVVRLVAAEWRIVQDPFVAQTRHVISFPERRSLPGALVTGRSSDRGQF